MGQAPTSKMGEWGKGKKQTKHKLGQAQEGLILFQSIL
jgi:hypothetical protein